MAGNKAYLSVVAVFRGGKWSFEGLILVGQIERFAEAEVVPRVEGLLGDGAYGSVGDSALRALSLRVLRLGSKFEQVTFVFCKMDAGAVELEVPGGGSDVGNI